MILKKIKKGEEMVFPFPPLYALHLGEKSYRPSKSNAKGIWQTKEIKEKQVLVKTPIK